MNDVMIYVLKSVFVLLLLYVPYTLLLRKEKFFRMNRITLIAILVLSLVVPFCNFPSLYWADGIADAIPVESDGSRYFNELMYMVERPSEREGIIRVTEQVGEEEPKAKHESSVPLNQSTVSQPESGVVQTSKTGLGMMELLAYIYIIGVGVAIVFRLWQFVRMERLMRHGCLWKDTQEGITVYCKTQDITPYSWMNSIVISQKDYETHRREILLHEKGHVICRHSLDILLLTVVQTLQWFNPFVYMFGSSLRDIHEYEADDYVLRQGVSADAYQNLLLKTAIGSSSYTFANSFNHSLIKNRIIMMKEEQKSSWMRCKVLYILPLTFVALCVFASPKSEEKKSVAEPLKIVETPVKPAEVVAEVESDVTEESADNTQTAELQDTEVLDENEKTPEPTGSADDVESMDDILLMFDGKVVDEAEFEKLWMEKYDPDHYLACVCYEKNKYLKDIKNVVGPKYGRELVWYRLDSSLLLEEIGGKGKKGVLLVGKSDSVAADKDNLLYRFLAIKTITNWNLKVNDMEVVGDEEANFVLCGTVMKGLGDKAFLVNHYDEDGDFEQKPVAVVLVKEDGTFTYRAKLDRPTKGRIRATFEDGSICSAWIDEEFVPGEVLHILVMNGHYRAKSKPLK